MDKAEEVLATAIAVNMVKACGVKLTGPGETLIARAQLQALADAGLVVEQGWCFDMENAPKDKLLDLTDGKIVVMAEWDAIDHDPQSGEDVYWWQPYDNVRATEFFPTAWRPRPSLPVVGNG